MEVPQSSRIINAPKEHVGNYSFVLGFNGVDKIEDEHGHRAHCSG